MPAKNTNPKGAVQLSFSLAHLANEPLYTDSNGDVSAPSSWLTTVFEDVNDLLNGKASDPSRTLAGVVNNALVALGVPGSFTASITNGDKVRLTYSLGAFSLRALNAANPFGFSTTLTASSGGSVTAPVDFSRGTFNHSVASLEITIGITTVTAFFDVGTHAGVLYALRSQTLEDSLTGCADSLMANDGRTTTRFFLNNDGLVEIWRDSTYGALYWLSTELRDILGFTGAEVQHSSGGSVYVRASYPPRFLIWINGPIEYAESFARAIRSSAEASDGRREIKHIRTDIGWEFRFFVTGIMSNEDKRAELIDNFWRYYFQAASFTVYQDVNEIRRAVALRDGYDLAKCGELNYRVGTIRLVDSETGEFTASPEDPTYVYRYYMALKGWEYVSA